MSMINSKEIITLEKFLDLSLTRQAAISSNIANANTPNYKARKVNFEDELKKALSDGNGEISLKTTNQKHISTGDKVENVSPEVEISSDPARPDGNNVDLEKEMVELTKNNIKYNLGVQVIHKMFKDIEFAITGDRR